MLVLVTAVAVAAGLLRLSIVAVRAALQLFHFLPPVGRLTIADPQNWVALGWRFCAASVLVSHLAEERAP